MPRTRTHVTRAEKIDQIVDAAQKRLEEGGYDALSVASVARELGLSQNAIYWYFPSKGDLFVAVLQRRLRKIVERKPRGTRAVPDRVLWFADQFAPLYELQAPVREQARDVKVVADFVSELDALLDRMLSNALRDRVPPERLEASVESFRTTVIGTYAQGLSRARRREILAFALDRLMTA
jgi:AcrR family transcriptional regulator